MIGQVDAFGHGLNNGQRVSVSDQRVDGEFAVQTLIQRLVGGAGGDFVFLEREPVGKTRQREDSVGDAVLGDEDVFTTPQQGVFRVDAAMFRSPVVRFWAVRR